MGTINELNTTDTLAGDDKLVIWKDQAGATRAITAADAAAYFVGGASYQPLDEMLTSIAALGPTSVADRYFYTTAQDTVALGTITSFGRSLISSANAGAALAAIGAQPVDATLSAIAALVTENHDLIFATGVDTFEAKTQQLKNEVLLEWSGGGAGTASLDQAAIAAAAAAGQMVRLLKGVTYYMTAGITPVTGFGMIFEPGSKIVAVTQASGSGSAGFKNYSGSGPNRNAPAGTMFMLTASGGVFTFVNPTFEGDNANQPILRPIFAQGCTLNIYGKITVTKMNAPNGCLSLNEMLGGFVEGYDFRANADMVDASYTDLINYSPAGIVIDDDGTFRSSRMTFGPGVVKAFNRASGGSDPYESDGITVGGIGKSLRSGAVGGHVFGPIYVEDLGEGVDCFQDDCVFESITARSCALFGVKFVHGAQSNVVQWVDVDTYGSAAITFAGSSDTATATRDNVVIDGIVRNGGKIGTGEVSVVLFQENGGTGVARANRVELREAVVDADTDYLAKDNHSGSALDNRVRIRVVTGALGASAAATTVASNLQLRVGGSLTRLTLSGNQTGIVTATYTTVTFDTVQIDLLSEAVTASNKIRIKYPGRYVVRTSVRMGLNDGDEIETRILKNGVGSTGGTKASGSSTIAENYTAERFIHVTENEAGTADADYRVEVRVVSSGSITITNPQLLTFFEIASFD
jgi:hypothetical protein